MKNWDDGMLDLWGDVPKDFLREKNGIFEHCSAVKRHSITPILHRLKYYFYTNASDIEAAAYSCCKVSKSSFTDMILFTL